MLFTDEAFLKRKLGIILQLRRTGKRSRNAPALVRLRRILLLRSETECQIQANRNPRERLREDFGVRVPHVLQ